MSIGEGRKSTTASSMGCTPLFLNAEPHSTGTNSNARVPVRMAALISSAVSSSPSRYFSIRWSSTCAIVSSSSWRAASAASAYSAGMSTTSNFAPSVSSSSGHTTAFIATRSMTPAEVALRADRKLDDGGHRVEAVAHHLDAALEVGADAVHLVDEAEARDVVLVGLAPHRLGLRLDAGDRVEHRDRAVEDAQAALDLDREVDVAGRVDDVDLAVVPLRGRGGRGDRDAALLLLDHVVHDRGAFVHLADLVGATGVVEDPLGRRGLARVDVSHDPDVAGLFEGKFACHLGVLFGLRRAESFGRGDVSGLAAVDRAYPIARGPVGRRGPGNRGARSASRRGQRRSAAPLSLLGSSCLDRPFSPRYQR